MSLGSKSDTLVRGPKRRTGVRRKRAAGAKTTDRTARRIAILADRSEERLPHNVALPVLLTAEMVRAHALEAFGDAAKVAHWLRRPNQLFQGRTPLQVLRTDPAAVEAELVRIEHGVYV